MTVLKHGGFARFRGRCMILAIAAVLISHASNAALLESSCYQHDGNVLGRATSQLCFPPVRDLALLSTTYVTATSNCQWNETFCYQSSSSSSPSSSSGSSVGSIAKKTGLGGPAVICTSCRATNRADPHTRMSDYSEMNTVDKNNATFWLSAPLVRPRTAVVLNAAMHRPNLVFSVRLVFPEISVPSFAEVHGSADSGQTWRGLAVLRSHCDNTYSRAIPSSVACYTISKHQRVADVKLVSEQDYRAATADTARLARLTEANTFTNLRLVFREIHGIVLDRNTAARQQLSQFFFYGLSTLSIRGMCQCSGHASQCQSGYFTTSGQHTPQCQCRHGTSGSTCSLCGADMAKRDQEVLQSPDSTISAAFMLGKCNDFIMPANTNHSFSDPTTLTPISEKAGSTSVGAEASRARIAEIPGVRAPPTVTNLDVSGQLLSQIAATEAVATEAFRVVPDKSSETDVNETEAESSIASTQTAMSPNHAQKALSPAREIMTRWTHPGLRSTAATASDERVPTTSASGIGEPTPVLANETALSASEEDGEGTLASTTAELNETDSTENNTVGIGKTSGFVQDIIVYAAPAAAVAVAVALGLFCIYHQRQRRLSRNTFVPTKYSEKALQYDGSAFANFVTPQSFLRRNSMAPSPNAGTTSANGSAEKNAIAMSQRTDKADRDSKIVEQPEESLTLENPATETALSISSKSSDDGDGAAAGTALLSTAEVTVNPCTALSMVADHSGESSGPDKDAEPAVKRRASRTKSVPDQIRRSWVPDNTVTPTYVNLKRIQSAYQYNKAQQAQALQVQLATATLSNTTSFPSNPPSLPSISSPYLRGPSPQPRLSQVESIDAYTADHHSTQGSITTTGTNDELFYACSDLDLNSSLMNCSIASSPMEPELMMALRYHHRRQRPPSRANSLHGNSNLNNASASESDHPTVRVRSRPKRSKSIHSASPASARRQRYAAEQRSATLAHSGQGHKMRSRTMEHQHHRHHHHHRYYPSEKSSSRHYGSSGGGGGGGRPTPRPRSRRAFHHDINSTDRPYQSDSATRPASRASTMPPDHVIDDIISIASSLSRRKTVLMDPHSPPREPPAAPPQLDPCELPSTPTLNRRRVKGTTSRSRDREDGDGMTTIDHGDNDTEDDHHAMRRGPNSSPVPTLGRSSPRPHPQSLMASEAARPQRLLSRKEIAMLSYAAQHKHAPVAESYSTVGVQGEPAISKGSALAHTINQSTGRPIRSILRKQCSLPLEPDAEERHHVGSMPLADGSSTAGRTGAKSSRLLNSSSSRSSGSGSGSRSSANASTTSEQNSGGTRHNADQTATMRTELHFDITQSNANVVDGHPTDVNHPESFIIHL
eukprot:scpid23001/ scgid6908/ Netrin unc-6; Uncoordinated protein 6